MDNLIKDGDLFLDLCTGTGSVAIEIAKRGKRAVGVDFSKGMIKKAREKAALMGLNNLYFVVGDVTNLPFKDHTFDGCSFSHAFYELKGEEGKRRALSEAKRVLKENGIFCMMEHEVPKSLLTRFLFYLRLISMGKKDAVVFLKKEMEIIGEFFKGVRKSLTPSGKSKLISGRA